MKLPSPVPCLPFLCIFSLLSLSGARPTDSSGRAAELSSNVTLNHAGQPDPEDRPGADSAADETGIQGDAAGTVDSLAADSLRDTTAIIDESQDSGTGSGLKPQPGQPAATAPADTSLRFYNSPFIAFGTGWTLGSMPLFEEWADGLPDSIGDMPGYENLTRTYRIVRSETKLPDAYHTAFPFMLSVVPFVNEQGYLSVLASLNWMSKNFTAVWQTDSAGTFWDVERRLTFLNASLGSAYFYRIPSRFFTIANIDRAFLVAGLLASPYVRITDAREGYSEVTGLRESSEKKYRGYGVTWNAGISTLRTLSNRAGLEVGAVYEGHWTGRFIKHDHHVKWGAIHPESADAGEVLGFIAHRFKVYFCLCIGRTPAPESGKNGSASGTERPEKSPSAVTGAGMR